jgi:hypothetical protein
MIKSQAIRNTHSNVVTIRGVEAFDQDDNPIVLNETLVQTEITRLQAIYDSQEYARSRQQEYPSIQECIHAILDDDLTALQEKRQAVKDKYPKESK